MTIEDTAALYRASGIGTVIVAGANYGIGSARDWAAKATAALGVRAVVARSFERIHRTNLALVGVLPVQADGLPDRLEGWRIAIPGPRDTLEPGGRVSLTLTPPTVGPALRIEGICWLDTAFEIECWRGEGMMALARSRALSAASR